MGKGLKWILVIVGGLVVVVIAALIILPFFLDINKYKPEIEKRVAETTGRTFRIGSDLDLSLFPFAGIKFSRLELGSPKGFEEKEFVTIENFEVRIKLLPLLSREVQVKRFVMTKPRIVLVKNKNGKANWVFGKPHERISKHKPEPSRPHGVELPIKKLDVREFAVTKGAIVYVDHSSGLRKEISDVDLTLDDVSLESPIQVKFTAAIDKKPIRLEGMIGPIGKTPGTGTVNMDLSLKALEALAVVLTGKVTDPAVKPAFELDIKVDEFSPRKLVAALGQEFPINTTDAKALSRVSLALSVKGGINSVSVSGGSLGLDDSKLTFSAKAKDFLKPDIAFDINLDDIDLDRYLPPPSEKKETDASKPSPKKNKPDYAPLRRMVLEGAVNIGKLKVHGLRIQDVVVKLAGKNSIFSLNPMAMKLYDGDTNLNGVLNVQKDTPQTTVNITAKTIQAAPLLKDLMNKDLIEGAGSATVALAFSGDTADAIKKTLSGKGQLRFEDGAVIGVDIASMVRNVQSAFGYSEKLEQKPKTDFTELDVPFTIKNGLVNTPGSRMQSPLLRLIAAGNADLVKETLDFRIEPKLVATIKGQGDTAQRRGLLVPVLVSGTFSSPKFRPDLKAIAQEQLKKQVLESEEAKKLMEKKELKQAKEKARGMLKGILGQ